MTIFTEVFLMLSIWILLLSLTVRAVSILKPFQVAEIFLKKRCKAVIAALSIVFFFISGLYYFPCIYFDDAKGHCRINDACTTIHKIFYLYRSIITAWMPSLLSMNF